MGNADGKDSAADMSAQVYDMLFRMRKSGCLKNGDCSWSLCEGGHAWKEI